MLRFVDISERRVSQNTRIMLDENGLNGISRSQNGLVSAKGRAKGIIMKSDIIAENAQADALRHVSKSRVYSRVPKGIGAFSKMMRSLDLCYNITMTSTLFEESQSTTRITAIIIYYPIFCKKSYQCLFRKSSEFIYNTAVLFHILESVGLFRVNIFVYYIIMI